MRKRERDGTWKEDCDLFISPPKKQKLLIPKTISTPQQYRPPLHQHTQFPPQISPIICDLSPGIFCNKSPFDTLNSGQYSLRLPILTMGTKNPDVNSIAPETVNNRNYILK